MSNRLAAVAYRLLAPRATGGTALASGDDLANENTTPLPNGALAVVASADGPVTLLQLDRSVGSPASAAFSDGVPLSVAPNHGPGQWTAIAGEAIERLSFNVDATVFNTTIVTSGADEWSAFPDATPLISSAGGALGPLFTLTAAGAVLTYTGPTRKFKFSQQLSMENATGANADTMQLNFSINGGGIGATTAFAAAGSTQQGTNQLQQQLSSGAVLALGPGATIQPIFRSLVGDDYTLVRWHLSVVAA